MPAGKPTPTEIAGFLAQRSTTSKGDYVAGIADYDRLHGQILDMADMLSDGIVAQFPEKSS